ncbi:hypothetical protein [Mycolicibacterium wolinskyi]|uniref:hypothetical protein n=1 Tax=Mycolicibacterium wolinskyi TaxID=59750 RepID=UPI0039179757
MTALEGITWDHPRGYAALAAAQSEDAAPACEIRWSCQPLEGFESAPIAETASHYDLIVLDHPHIGEAIDTAALRPIDEFVDAATLAEWRASTVGASFDSYFADDRQWAVPLDAATQVSVGTPEITGDMPATWTDAVEFARDVPTSLPLGGPHPFLTLCAIAISEGAAPAATPDCFLPEDVVATAVTTMRQIVGSADGDINPIGLLERMSASTGPQYCPLVYGYVNYALATLDRPLTFADAPRGTAGVGSVLGGTGIAVSARCAPTAELAAHLRWLVASDTQTVFVPRHHGQPCHRAAWESPDLNAEFGEFYRNTRATVDAAWVRPRYHGFIAVQSHGAEHVRQAVRGDMTPRELSERLTTLHHNASRRVPA